MRSNSRRINSPSSSASQNQLPEIEIVDFPKSSELRLKPEELQKIEDIASWEDFSRRTLANCVVGEPLSGAIFDSTK